MKKGYTDIVMVVDRSGSMASCKSDMEWALINYVDELKKEDGDFKLSYYIFDTVLESKFVEKPIKDIGELKIEPRGLTALYDAMGAVINFTGARLASKHESDRPERVLFVVITDGLENSSKEYGANQISEMVKHQTDKYNWGFVYLGANQDAIAVGGSIGISLGNSMTYNTSERGLMNTSMGLYNYTHRYAQVGATSFTDEERSEAVE